jgi:hypothetical protein
VTVKIYINKILKDKGLKPLPKKTKLIGNNCMTIAFESLKEKVSGLKKNKVLSKDESEILCLALHNAKVYGPLLDMYDDIDGRIIAAQKILRGGRNKKNMGEALDIIMDREKGAKHAKIDWPMLADDYIYLTITGDNCGAVLTPSEAINEMMEFYAYPRRTALHKAKITHLKKLIRSSLEQPSQADAGWEERRLKQLEVTPVREIVIPVSAQSLLKGLKRFKKSTRNEFYKNNLKNLPWQEDDLDDD